MMNPASNIIRYDEDNRIDASVVEEILRDIPEITQIQG
jgi:hypothetical protein